MKELLNEYKSRPWPKLEIPPLKRPQITVLVLFVAALITGGWYIWFSGNIQAEYFILLALAVPVLFILKNRYVTIIGLLSFQVVIAFLFVGNANYALSAVALLVVTVIAFESPMVMYILLLFAVWFDKSPFVSGVTLTMEFIVGAGLLVGWFFNTLLKPQVQKINLVTKLTLPALLFLGLATLGFLLWCYERYPAGWAQYKYILAGVLFFIITPLVIRTEKQLNILIWTWVILGLIAAVSTIVAPMLGYQPEVTSWGGSSGTFSWHKNISGSFLCFSFFLTYAWYRKRHPSLSKLILFFILAITIVALIDLQSRSAVVALAAGLLVFTAADTFYIKSRRKPMRILVNLFLVFSVLLILVTVVYVIELDELLGTYGDIFNDPGSSGSIEIRLMIWDAAWKIMVTENHLIRGLGPGAFWVLGFDEIPIEPFLVEDMDKVQELTGQNLYLQTHNLYIDILLHYGLIGLILMIWLNLYIIKILWRMFRTTPDYVVRYLCLGIICALTAFWSHAVLDFSSFNITRYWVYLGLAAAVMTIHSQKETAILPGGETV
jgi:O-antigen ligase